MGQVALLGGLPRLVYSTVLTVDALTLDTGANVIPAGFNVLEIFAMMRTDEAVTVSTGALRFNGDSGNNYDSEFLQGLNAAASAGNNRGVAQVPFDIAGASLAAGVASQLDARVTAYAGTAFAKVGEYGGSIPSQAAATIEVLRRGFGYRQVTPVAINQVALSITSGAGQKFKAGSALYVYVR